MRVQANDRDVQFLPAMQSGGNASVGDPPSNRHGLAARLRNPGLCD